MRRIATIMAICFWLPFTSFTQELDENILRLLENRLNQEEDIDYEAFYDLLFNLYSNPIDINRASRDELRAIGLLEEAEVDAIVYYREANGALLNIYELQAIPGIQLSRAKDIAPFFKVAARSVRDGSFLQRVLSEKSNFVVLEQQRVLQKALGYSHPDPDKAFAGSPDRIRLRARSQHAGDYSLGLTLEKDAGESLAWKPQNKMYLADYLSGHISLYNRGVLQHLSIGDYYAQFGQGLVFGGGFNLGKGSETIRGLKRSSLGIKPYTSINESAMLRGAAVTFRLGDFTSSTLFSLKNLDANLEYEISREEFVVRSLNYSGLHRNNDEIERKGSISELLGGQNFTYHGRNGRSKVGLNLLLSNYSKPVAVGNRLYQIHRFSGKTNSVASVFADYSWQNALLFGEGAFSQMGSFNLIMGTILAVDPRLDLGVIYRRYHASMHNFYANAFGESSTPSNERGLYLGIKARLRKDLVLGGYFDRYRFPWLTFRSDRPLQGQDYLVMVSFSRRNLLQIHGQMRVKSHDGETGIALYRHPSFTKRSFRISVKYQPHQVLSFHTRIQHSRTLETNSIATGVILAQDLDVVFKKFSIRGRYAIFDTEDFENRQYLFEKDVLFNFSIPAHQGLGARYYLLLSVNLTPKISLRFKLAQFNYYDRESTGSGVNQIEGNLKTELKSQVKIKL